MHMGLPRNYAHQQGVDTIKTTHTTRLDLGSTVCSLWLSKIVPSASDKPQMRSLNRPNKNKKKISSLAEKNVDG